MKTTTSKYIKPYNIDKRLEKSKQEFLNSIHVDEERKIVTVFKYISTEVELYILNKEFRNYIVNVEGSVNINSDVTVCKINWGYVNGNFLIAHKKPLSSFSLPKEIRGNFYCNRYYNKLNTTETINYIKKHCIVNDDVLVFSFKFVA